MSKELRSEFLSLHVQPCMNVWWIDKLRGYEEAPIKQGISGIILLNPTFNKSERKSQTI
jgi:hypothetical protein